LLPVFESLIASVEQQGVDPELLMPVIGVRQEYLATALDRVEQMGGLGAYLASLGIDEHTLDRLRDRLTH
jgi:protein-tyrosine phosphatase